MFEPLRLNCTSLDPTVPNDVLKRTVKVLVRLCGICPKTLSHGAAQVKIRVLRHMRTAKELNRLLSGQCQQCTIRRIYNEWNIVRAAKVMTGL